MPAVATCSRRRLLPLLLPLLPILWSAAAGATTTARPSDGELIDRSSLVVVGHCVETRTVRLDRRLVTLARFRPDEVLKGEAPEGPGDLTVVLPGGREEGGPFPLTEVWPGAPSLVSAERAVLFLRPFEPWPGGWAMVGFSQGKFAVVEGAGEARAVRDLTGTSLRRADGSVEPGGARGEPLRTLAERVRARVRETGGEAP